MAWNEQRFRDKVYAEAKAQGRSVRSVLSEADVAYDFFDKGPIKGRRIDTLDRIAVSLGYVDYVDLMGAEPRVNDAIMARAYEITKVALRRVIDVDEAMPKALSTAYNVLLRYHREGKPINDLDIANTLVRTLAEHYGAAGPTRR